MFHRNLISSCVYFVCSSFSLETHILLQHWKSIFTYFHCSIQFNSVHKPKIEAQHSGATTDVYLLYSFVIVINILHVLCVCVSGHFTAYVFVTITFKQSNEKCLIKQKQMISTECIIQTEIVRYNPIQN